MKLHKKVPAAKTAIQFISRHDDEPAQFRLMLLEELKAFIDAEIAAAEAREQAQAEKELAPG